MPSYTYECEYCRKEWEEFHGFEESPEMCPFCEEKNFKKVYRYSESAIKPLEKSTKAGKKTRNFIEESRQNLKEYKAEKKK